MKIHSLNVVLAPSAGPSNILAGSKDSTSSLPFLYRSNVKEFMLFYLKTVAERTPPETRQSISEKGYVFHVYKRSVPENLAAVVITDEEYPVRPAFSLLTKLLDDFTAKFPESSFNDPLSISFPEIDTYAAKYEDPRQADAIMKVQQELDETKIILHKTIESVLQRGEKINDLVDRSQALSAQSKLFYKTAKKQNSCCVIM